jgi:hypothetical protein
MDWIDLAQGKRSGSTEHSNEHLGYIKCGKFLDYLSFSGRTLFHGVCQVCAKLHTYALYFSHSALLTAMFIHCDLPTCRMGAIPACYA